MIIIMIEMNVTVRPRGGPAARLRRAPHAEPWGAGLPRRGLSIYLSIYIYIYIYMCTYICVYIYIYM